MKLCRHFDPVNYIRGCAVGRIAFVDCGPGCTSYDAVPDEAAIDREIVEGWNGLDAETEDAED